MWDSISASRGKYGGAVEGSCREQVWGAPASCVVFDPFGRDVFTATLSSLGFPPNSQLRSNWVLWLQYRKNFRTSQYIK